MEPNDGTETEPDGAATLSVDDIDVAFVPQLADGLVALELDGELVVVAEVDLAVTHLDRIGTIVWQCFDGEATLGELIDDISDAFGEDRDVIERDVLELTRALGRAGLLAGVAPVARATGERSAAIGLPVGTPIELPASAAILTRTGGADSSIPHRTLLVNWSPSCSFCVQIAPELAELSSALHASGVEVALLSRGDIDENRGLLERANLDATLLLSDDPAFEDPFAGFGTPVAYLLDDEGRVAAPIAIGRLEVPNLARAAMNHGETT